eukprot:3395073-Karenia_brevis.AAC.1
MQQSHLSPVQQTAAINKGIFRREGVLGQYQERMRKLQLKIYHEQENIAELTYGTMRLKEATSDIRHADIARQQ